MTSDLTFDLAEPGMTPWHRAGLVGLVASCGGREPIAGWKPDYLSKTRVRFRDVDLSTDGLYTLMTSLYRINRDGLIRFPVLGDANEATLAEVQGVLLNTFLQHPQSRVAAKTFRDIAASEYDDKSFRYLPLTDFRHRSRDVCEKLAVAFETGAPMDIAGWAMPGGVVRHVAHPRTTLRDPAHRYLLLICAPLGCLWHRAISYVSNGDLDPKTQAIVVVPNADDVEATVKGLRRRTRREAGATATQWVTGVSDAALQAGLSISFHQASDAIVSSQFYVLRFGKVGWSKQQVTRTAALTVKVSGTALRRYEPMQTALANQRRGENGFQFTMPMRERIARNILEGRPWYLGYSDYASGQLGKRMGFWREGLRELVGRSELWDGERKRDFVALMHSGIRNRLGQVSTRAGEAGADRNSVFTREYQRMVLEFSRCRTHEMFRETLMRFMANSRPRLSGSEGTVERDVLMQAFTASEWRELRDLCLLAIATYRGRHEEEIVPETEDDELGSAADTVPGEVN